MRQYLSLNENWQFTMPGKEPQQVNIPHTWNNLDGQDGGDDYVRCTCLYEKTFAAPVYTAGQRVYLQFDGANASAVVTINGKEVMRHDGGYSTFRADVTDFLQPENHLQVAVDNSKNKTVYPQKADFTFYGGIYRDVRLLLVSAAHFDLDYFGGPGIQVSAKPVNDYRDGLVTVNTWHNGNNGEVKITLYDDSGAMVAEGNGTEVQLTIENVKLWHGLKQPYLYSAKAQLLVEGTVVDEISTAFGIRDFSADPQKGFFLNGKPYPLRGVCRHQDRKGLGNAITKEMHDEDMALILEIGANTLRLAHYQHDQYFYDLCDRYGIVVWAEIPYISEHMNEGRANTISQMKELIVQNFNHPSIITWGVSNEITISTRDHKDMLDNHHVLNDLCHEMDPTRLTSLACYAVCGPFNKVAHITDIVSWNLYLGWYVPGFFLNDLWVDFFHKVYPNRCLGYSEYGAEGMPNLHSSHPRRGDHSEEYQAKYHEYLVKFIEKRPWMWATHVWNMFDFAADARDQGGEPGMNHKGLVTFDRKTKKDSFYLYKAWWSKEPFVHICGSRYVDRPEKITTVKVYSNCPKVTLKANGKVVGEAVGNRIFTFRVTLEKETKIEAICGDCHDEAVLRFSASPNPSYSIRADKAGGGNWT